MALKRCLFKTHVRQPDLTQESEQFADSKSQSEISTLRDIYLDQDQTFQPLQLISRALVDQQFSRFIMKVPTLLEHYSNKNRPQLVELESQVEKRVKQAYWNQYRLFRETFGLKLNYSVKREKGINEVRLVKRLERKWFKPPEEESKADEDETFLENTKDQDNSFVSISEDQLNRSILSNTSAFTLGLQDKFNQSTGFVLGKSLKKDDQSSLAAYTQADLVREPTPLQNIQDLSDIELHQEFTRDLEEKRVVEQFAKTEQIEGYQGIKMLDESSLAAEETLKKSKAESQEPALQEDVFTTQAKELAAAQTGFAQTDIDFMTKLGRAISPLEANQKATDESNALDESEHDQLYHLKRQIGFEKSKHAPVKKGLKVLEKVVWRKQTHHKFAGLYAMRVFVERKASIERQNVNAKAFGAVSSISAGSGSNKDDSTSMG